MEDNYKDDNNDKGIKLSISTPRRDPPPHHHQEVDALIILDVLAKTPGLYLVPELRYRVKYLVEKK